MIERKDYRLITTIYEETRLGSDDNPNGGKKKTPWVIVNKVL